MKAKLKKPLRAKKSFPAKDKRQPVKSNGDKSKDIITLILRDHDPIKKLILILKDSDIGITEKRPAYSKF